MESLSLNFLANRELLRIIFISLIIFGILYLLTMPFKNKRFIIILTAIYAFLTFYDLGSSKSPETFYEVTKNNSHVIIELNDENRSFDKIYAFSLEGEPVNSDYRYQIYFRDIVIEASNDLKNWAYLTTLDDEEWGKWCVKELPVSYDFRYIRLTFPHNYGVINEIAFYDSENRYFLNTSIYEADDETYNPQNLIDERDCILADFDYQNETYFDEIYHVRNAYEIANNLPLYTAVHPLLGTRLIALGIKIFGMNPFGYRFFGALTSVIMVPLFYLLIYFLFHEAKWAKIGALLFSLDFMHYTTGRIATLEPFSLLFILLMYLFMICFMHLNYLKKLKKALIFLGLSGLSMALAWATKWTGIYASIGLAICFFFKLYQVLKNTKDKQKVKKTIIVLLFCIIFFVILPLIVYVLVFQGIYIYDTLPHNIIEAIKQVIDYTEYMFTYHSGLESTHPYSSKWYMWLLDIRPIWYYVNRLGDNIQTISCFNNPAISLMGLFAVIYTLIKTIKKTDKQNIIIVAAYFSSLIPWIFISRTTFSYHYYPCIPFLILAIIYFFYRNKKERLLKIFLVLSIILFIAFLPAIGGFMTKQFYVSHIIRFLPSWYFG